MSETQNPSSVVTENTSASASANAVVDAMTNRLSAKTLSNPESLSKEKLLAELDVLTERGNKDTWALGKVLGDIRNRFGHQSNSDDVSFANLAIRCKRSKSYVESLVQTNSEFPNGPAYEQASWDQHNIARKVTRSLKKNNATDLNAEKILEMMLTNNVRSYGSAHDLISKSLGIQKQEKHLAELAAEPVKKIAATTVSTLFVARGALHSWACRPTMFEDDAETSTLVVAKDIESARKILKLQIHKVQERKSSTSASKSKRRINFFQGGGVLEYMGSLRVEAGIYLVRALPSRAGANPWTESEVNEEGERIVGSTPIHVPQPGEAMPGSEDIQPGEQIQMEIPFEDRKEIVGEVGGSADKV